ncbi:hypothetical protein TRAPUB_3548 [Trametes pubescens]|uniref:Uncharacterized protein n=1 Tax=Trametes pubescens TaxID=154538 RepID=A0A1M2VDG6_TRAPU|nr:hypothetical protein TRAPUB_3548 [Trametes pubescens]
MQAITRVEGEGEPQRRDVSKDEREVFDELVPRDDDVQGLALAPQSKRIGRLYRALDIP